MTLTKQKPVEMANLVHDLQQELHLSQEKFAARSGVSFKTVNRWQQRHTVASAMALKLIEDSWRLSGKQTCECFVKAIFPRGGLNV